MSVESLARPGRSETVRPRAARPASIPYRLPEPQPGAELSARGLRLLWLLVAVCTLTGTAALVALVGLL